MASSCFFLFLPNFFFFTYLFYSCFFPLSLSPYLHLPLFLSFFILLHLFYFFSFSLFRFIFCFFVAFAFYSPCFLLSFWSLSPSVATATRYHIAAPQLNTPSVIRFICIINTAEGCSKSTVFIRRQCGSFIAWPQGSDIGCRSRENMCG